MAVGRRLEAKQPREVGLSRGGFQKIAPAHHLIHAHEPIVDHDGQLVGEHAVAALHEEVAAFVGEHFFLRAVGEVAELYRACGVVLAGHAQTRRRGAAPGALGDLIRGKVAASSGVQIGAVRGVGGRGGVELGSRAEAWVGESGLAQPADRLLIYIRALALPVGAFVPREAEPFEVGHQAVRDRPVLCPGIEVLNAQDDAPAGTSCREPCHEAREHVAQVHPSGGRGREAADHGGSAACTHGVRRRHRTGPCA